MASSRRTIRLKSIGGTHQNGRAMTLMTTRRKKKKRQKKRLKKRRRLQKLNVRNENS